MTIAYKLSDIEFSYDSSPVIKLDKYSIEEASVTAIVGPNGAGKSTLLNMLAFIDTPSHGHIDFFGRKAFVENYLSLRRHVGYVQQKPYLLNTSVFKNIEIGLKLRKVGKKERFGRVVEIIEQLGIGDLAHRRAHELSGGEMQKVAVARAMILEPKVLIFDEPFSHLDDAFKNELEGMIRTIKNDCKQTIIFSTHDQIQAQVLADQICSLVDGHAVPISVINLFNGKVDEKNNLFVTDKIAIPIPANIKKGARLSVESTQLVLSKKELESSMRDMFHGKIKSLKDENGQIHVVVDAGEKFHAIITLSALYELNINVGDKIWVSFKSTAVRVF